jgi:lipopolysaccharide export LptBFGC system permease protein LptF
VLPGILLYAVMALVMPADSSVAAGEVGAGRTGRAALAGVILIVVGALLLLGNFGFLAWWSWGRLWPLVLILAGAILLMRRRE